MGDFGGTGCVLIGCGICAATDCGLTSRDRRNQQKVEEELAEVQKGPSCPSERPFHLQRHKDAVTHQA